MTGNGDDQVREAVMSRVRAEIRVLAEDGLSIEAIERRMFGGTTRFSETERELVRLIARSEVASAPKGGVGSKSLSGGKRSSKARRARQQNKDR